MAIFDVLHPDTQVLGSYFLEASAGTGKTFAIEHIVPRLLLEVEDPTFLLSHILVVTFTRAATRELRLRIYQNLLKIRSALEGQEEGPVYLEPYKIEGKRQKAKQRIEEALCFFEEAQVFTLHGFCLKILQEFAFETKFLLSSSEEEKCKQTEKLQEYIKDFLRRGIDLDVICLSQLKRVVQKTGKEIQELCDALVRCLEGGQKIHTYPTARESYLLWNDALKSLPSVSSQDLWHDFSLLSRRSQMEKAQKQALTFFSWVEKKSCSFEEWDFLLGEEEFFLQEIRFSTSSKKQDSLLLPGLLLEIQKIFVPLYEEVTDSSRLLLSLAKAASMHYEKARVDLSHFSPDDLVYELQGSLLKDERFCEKVRSKFRSVIIDEFQDTDPSQFSIFETLFLQKPNQLLALYLVGDPKQSIYAFRRADVYLYLRAASLLGDKSIAYLDTNFRSHPHLVHALNEFFSWNLPSPWMLLPLLKTGLDVRRVQSKPLYPSALDGEIKGRLHFFLIEDEQAAKRKWPREDIEERFLFPFMAQEIISLRKEKKYSLQQMAVLVKDRFQAMRLQQAFETYGIPCQMQKSLDVSTSLAYEVMKDLLLAASRAFDISALKRSLGGALFGYSSDAIEGSLENPLLQKAKEFFLELGSSFRKKGFGVFFQNILFSPSQNPKQTVLEDLLSREDPHLYFDLRQLCQILLENCPEGLYNPQILLDFLEKLRSLPLSSDALKLCSEEEEDKVQVMTLHKSKGLEFSIVFPIGLCSRHGQVEEFIFTKKGDTQEVAAASQDQEAFCLHLEEKDAEKLRQLYVALTRGKERVYVPIVISKEPQEIAQGSGAPLELLLGAIGLEEYSLEKVYANIHQFSLHSITSYLDQLQTRASISYEVVLPSSISAAVMEKPKVSFLSPPPLVPSIASDEFLLSFSSLMEGKKEEGKSQYLEPPLEEDLPLGAETGTVIHAILEHLCKADLHRSSESFFSSVLSFCKGSCLEGKEEKVFACIQEVLKHPMDLGGELVSLEQIPSSDIRVEMEFLYPFQSSFLKGFIDLIFRYQGRYYILDWKTNYLGPTKENYSLNNVEACMNQSGYFLQASIYTTALQKYLALFEKKAFSSLFGGVVYFFLRGTTAYFFDPKSKRSVLESSIEVDGGFLAPNTTKK
ncbi:MAG: UvrD-helicase domain-containing protein [Rhabdochlamydiaceae bacterium]|nr:UvrD-helicase domain-containing protein [Rhabdochlamydiaceae bacterium]